MSGLFIAFEGGDGAGKTTQAARLHQQLTEQGYDPTLVREPGSTELGAYLREYLINGQALSPLSELLLFEAARAELVAAAIAPTLDAGNIIITDRFAGSTVAYQGYGRGIDRESIAWLNDFATGGRYPDLTILLDVDPFVGLGRVKGRQLELGLNAGGVADCLETGRLEPDRFEDEVMAFHVAARRGFRQQAAANPERWLLIEGNRPIDEIAGQVWQAVRPLLPPHP